MTPAVYILCGIPFSGKSTLAHNLASRHGWTHVDVDAIVQSLNNTGKYDVTEEAWTEAFAISHEQVAASLERGQSVVHDATNYARIVRDCIRDIARQFHAPAHVIYVDIPIEQANQRRIANRAHSQRHQVTDADFREVVNDLEPPTEDESVLIFDGTFDVESWIIHYLNE